MKWLIVIGGVVLVVLIGAIAFAVIERWSEAPVMRRRINGGSSEYLAGRESLLDRVLLYFGRALAAIAQFLG